MADLFSIQTPFVPDDMAHCSKDQIVQWIADFKAIHISIEAQMASRKINAQTPGLLSNAEWNDYRQWLRAARMKVAGVLVMKRRLGRELHSRERTGNTARKVMLYPLFRDFAAAVRGWRDAPLPVREAASSLLAGLEEMIEQKDGKPA